MIAFALVFVIVLVLLRREGRARTIGTVLGVGGVLFLLGNLPFVIEDIGHPESLLGFVIGGAGFIGAPLAFVGMLGALLEWPTPAVRELTVE